MHSKSVSTRQQRADPSQLIVAMIPARQMHTAARPSLVFIENWEFARPSRTSQNWNPALYGVIQGAYHTSHVLRPFYQSMHQPIPKCRVKFSHLADEILRTTAI